MKSVAAAFQRVWVGSAAVLFFVLGAAAQTTNPLSAAEIQGRELAQKILAQRPTEGVTNTGVLEIRRGPERFFRIPIRFETRVAADHWVSLFEALNTNRAAVDVLRIMHREDLPNQYAVARAGRPGLTFPALDVCRVNAVQSESELFTPFADSDFWLCDLGLEFFHWPEQKIVRKEFARGRGCLVLESTRPHPPPNGYSRVDCWIDEETLGIVQARAYDAQGRLLKEFEPKSFKKINGQWELQDMEIRNAQTGSRTRVTFALTRGG